MDRQQTYSEETELKKLAGGSPEALENIYEFYSASLFRVVNRYLRNRDTTEDLVQEVFLMVWENRDAFAVVDNFQAYLITVSKNLALKYLKEIAKEEEAKKEWGKLVTEEIGSDKNTVEHQKELYQHILDAVSLLPEQRQKVYRMAKFEGLSYLSIAEHLDISPNTVRNHMVSANRFIRSYLNKNSVVITFSTLTALMI